MSFIELVYMGPVNLAEFGGMRESLVQFTTKKMKSDALDR